MSEKIRMKIYDGPLSESLIKTYDTFSARLEVGEMKSIQCANYVNWHEKYAKFQTKPTDIWVVSFAKAGTTWTQELVWCVMNDLKEEKAKQVLMKRFPFFEWDSLLPIEESEQVILEEGNPCNPGVTWEILNTMKDPRTIKSHLHMDLLPKNIWTSGAKIVYVCRDPRDVCVSYYYHSVKLDGFTGKFEDFYEQFVNDLVFFAPIWKHMLDFWKKRNDANILFIRYEELKEDLAGMIKKVSKFIGRDVSAPYLQEMVNHLSFSSMSTNKAVNNESIVTYDTDQKPKDIKFMRKGKVGDWRSHFSSEQTQRFQKWTEDCLKGSDFPYYQDYD